jgi:quinol-cytochrome oxidoreductase complex cytochrome b subunit
MNLFPNYSIFKLSYHTNGFFYIILMQLGAKHVQSPFIEFGKISTVLYFLYFTVIMYGVTIIENTFVDLLFFIYINKKKKLDTKNRKNF